MHDTTCMLNNVKEHIRANHMYPGEQGKSCFLSTCETTVWKIVEETFLNPDVTTPHRSDGNRIVFAKEIFIASWCSWKEWSTMFFCDRDLRPVRPKNCYCISDKMNFKNFVLNVYRSLHFWRVKSEMGAKTSRLIHTRRRSGQAS